MKTPLIGWKPIAYDTNIASARLRCYEPLKALRREGVSAELFRPENKDRYDILVLQKCSGPEDVKLAAAARERGARVIYDLCDNLFFFQPDDKLNAKRAERARRIAEYSDLITVPSEKMQETIQNETGKPVTLIPDPAILPKSRSCWSLLAQANKLRRASSRRQMLEILWYGNSSLSSAEGGLTDVLRIAPELEQLHGECPLRLSIISNSPALYQTHIEPLPFPTRYFAWRSAAHFCSLAPLFDVCVIPFSRNPVTECKSSNRISLSLSLGHAVVADGIPSYREFAPFAQIDNWQNGLREYALSPEKRLEHVRAGAEFVRQHYSLTQISRAWRDSFGL